MTWRQARFKGKDVWVEVDPAGQPVVSGGRVGMRYSDKAGAKVYRGGLSSIDSLSGTNRDLPEGVSADDSKKSGAGGKKKGRSSRGSGFGKAGTRTQAQAAAAKESARELVAGISPDAVVCFTDGACKGNPGPAGAGCVVKLPGGEVHEDWRALGRGTNNVGELTAIGMAMELLDAHDVPTDMEVHVLTDSKYSLGVLSMGWKAKANKELITDVKARVLRRKAEIHWIAGHVGIPENERADALANKGVDESRRG